ncbi:MAG: ABC transporter permease subunit [Dorea sp.]|jgi:putative spermidine/putrescine transport system permease protein|nr:ABC transporter permease subunit [Dorea sp.]
MRRKLTPYILLVPQALLTILFLIGLVNGITQSLGVIPAFGLTEPTLLYYKEVLTKPDLLKSVLYSLKIAFSSALLSTAAGVMLCALLVTSRKTKGKMMRIVQLPIIVPHVVVALFVINICSQNGLLARVCCRLGIIGEQQEFPMIIYDSHGIGIVIAYLWKEIPFIIYFVIALMANIDGKLGEASVNLGADKIQTFFRVTLPLCIHTICSGFLIIFVFALGAYELPFILGTTTPKALPVQAYIQYTHPDLRNRPYAMALNGIIIVISLVSAWIYFILMRKNLKKFAKK